MKKTIIALLALGGIAMGDIYTYNASMVGAEDRAAVHGFTFTLTNAYITPEEGSLPTTDITDFNLLSLTLGDRADGSNSASYGLLVLSSSNVILGKSNETSNGCNGKDEVFTFTNLTLNAATTYRFVTVDTSLFTSDHIGKTYGYGTAGSLSQNGNTISGGLKAVGVAVDLHTNKSTTGLNFTSSATFASEQSGWSPILSDITINVPSAPAVPEPTTATLSLLALAGLAVRRRRR